MILIGTAGAPHAAKEFTSFGGVAAVAALGLDAMEVEFTYGVRMGKETARELGEHARKNKISLSIHAPYFINLNAREAQKRKDSEQRILQSAELGHLMGARNICFHPGFYLSKSEPEVYDVIYDELLALSEAVKERGWAVRLCPETTGKRSQFGSWQELMELCDDISGLGMTLDFSHVWARANGKVDYDDVFSEMKKKLGAQFLKELHMHFSGMQYTAAGERKHLNLSEGAEPGFDTIASAMKKWKLGGTAICESPNLEEDALEMKRLL